MGGNNAACVVKTQASFYIPGDVVNGAVYFDSKKPYCVQKIIILIQGNQQAWWKGPPSTNNKPNKNANLGNQYTGKTKLIDTNFVLYQWGSNNSLKGQYTFPFSFHLPNFLPGTFEQKKTNYRGSIKYIIKAICVAGKSDKNIQAQQQLILREHKKSYEQSLYGQIFLYPQSCFKRKGVTKISCYFDKNHYIRGEQSIIICEIDNIKSYVPIQQIKCELIKTITLRAYLGQTKIITQSISSVIFPGVRANDAYTGNNAVREKIPLKYKNSNNPIHSSAFGQLVKCEYSIQVTPKFQGCCTKGQAPFEVKIIILHEGLKFEYPSQPQGWKPQVYNKSQILLNYGQKNQLLESMQSEQNVYPKY